MSVHCRARVAICAGKIVISQPVLGGSESTKPCLCACLWPCMLLSFKRTKWLLILWLTCQDSSEVIESKTAIRTACVAMKDVSSMHIPQNACDAVAETVDDGIVMMRAYASIVKRSVALTCQVATWMIRPLLDTPQFSRLKQSSLNDLVFVDAPRAMKCGTCKLISANPEWFSAPHGTVRECDEACDAEIVRDEL